MAGLPPAAPPPLTLTRTPTMLDLTLGFCVGYLTAFALALALLAPRQRPRPAKWHPASPNPPPLRSPYLPE